MRVVTIIALFLAMSSGARAGEDWDFSSSQKSRCSDGGQQQMNACLASAYSVSDRQLNKKYKRLIEVLEDSSNLKKAQIAWLRFRDLTCEYANSGVGQESSLYPFTQNACLIDLTEKRIRDMDHILNGNVMAARLANSHEQPNPHSSGLVIASPLIQTLKISLGPKLGIRFKWVF